MEPPAKPPESVQEPVEPAKPPAASSFTEVPIGSQSHSSLRTDTAFIVRTLVQTVEWFRRLVTHNDRTLEPARLARLEERFEQLRGEVEKQGFQDIEGVVDPMLIRLKVQDARQRLMDACYEEILNFYREDQRLYDLYKTLSELPPPAAGEFVDGKQSGLMPYSTAATDLIRGSFFSERLQQRKSMSWGMLRSFLLSTLPILVWMPKYRLPDLRGDVMAALTVAAMLIPQGMSYALLAGLPPEWGLYAGLVPMFIYALFGTSRELSIGPAAMVSLTIPSALTASGLLPPDGDPSYQSVYNALALCLALQTGVILLAAGIFQVGFIVENLLSAPVLSGFTQGAAVLIVVSQLKHVLGLMKVTGHADTLQDIMGGIVHHIRETNPYAVIMGVFVCLSIVAMRKINKQIPAALVMLLLTTLITYLTGASDNSEKETGLRGIKVLKELNTTLPEPRLPSALKGYSGSTFPVPLIGQAALLALLAFMESISVAKKFAGQNHYNVHTNQELVALGLCNFVGSFFNAFPSSASLARTAVNYQVGSRSPLCNALTAVLVALAILFLTRLLYYTPYACLGAIVITAAVHLIDPAEWRRLWRGDEHGDLLMLVITMLVTIFLSPVVGVGVAIGLSLLEFIYRAARPAFLELGRISGTVVYRDIATNPSAIVVPGVVVARFDARLAFYNCNWFQERLEELVEAPQIPVHTFVLDASSIGYIDSTGMRTFEELLINLKHAGVRLLIASAPEAVRDVLERFGVVDRIGASNFFPTVHAAVEAALAEREKQIKEQASVTVHSNGTAEPAAAATVESRDEGSHELRQRRGHWWDGLLPSSKPKETYIELADI